MLENQIVVLCTVPDRESGERIASVLVEERLAACVNLLPGVSSTYRWQGKVRHEAECLLIIKSVTERFDALRARIRALHAYELPEIIALPIQQGDPDYLQWIAANSAP